MRLHIRAFFYSLFSAVGACSLTHSDSTSPLTNDFKELGAIMPGAHLGLGSDALLGAIGGITLPSGKYTFTRQTAQDIQTVDQYLAFWAAISAGDTALGHAGISVASFSAAKVTSTTYRFTVIQIKDLLALADTLN